MTDGSDVNERVERVLANLREVEVPSGLEERVLRAVQTRASGKARERGLWLAWLREGGAYRWGAVAVLVVAVAALGRHLILRHGDAVGKREAVRWEPPAAALGRAGVAARVVMPRPHPATAKLVRAGAAQRVRHGGRETTVDDLAVSFPAPPLSLTEQERLLLRVVHGRDPVQVAMLDGVTSLEKFAEERAEFQRFFNVMQAAEVISPETDAPKVNDTPTAQGDSK